MPGDLLLTLDEREEFLAACPHGNRCAGSDAYWASASTISREIGRHGGLRHYRATVAGARAWRKGLRPKTCPIAQHSRLRRAPDRDKEMAAHKLFTIATDVQVYFCESRSLWQGGPNENTNGLLRKYFPKGVDISNLTERQLDAVAKKLNTRPRQKLDWKTPAEVFAEAVALTD